MSRGCVGVDLICQTVQALALRVHLSPRETVEPQTTERFLVTDVAFARSRHRRCSACVNENFMLPET